MRRIGWSRVEEQTQNTELANKSNRFGHCDRRLSQVERNRRQICKE
jgi:hypothetical protein